MGLRLTFSMLALVAPWESPARIWLAIGSVLMVWFWISAVGRRVGPDLRESFLQVREGLAGTGMAQEDGCGR